MRAEILSCGTELLLGHITDTNATYLAQSLAALGIDLYFVSQVGDNQGRIVETLRRAWESSRWRSAWILSFTLPTRPWPPTRRWTRLMYVSPPRPRRERRLSRWWPRWRRRCGSI